VWAVAGEPATGTTRAAVLAGAGTEAGTGAAVCEGGVVCMGVAAAATLWPAVVAATPGSFATDWKPPDVPEAAAAGAGVTLFATAAAPVAPGWLAAAGTPFGANFSVCPGQIV